MFFNDSSAKREPHARTSRFGCEERIEYFVHDVARHTVASIGNRHKNLSRAVIESANRKFTMCRPVRHRFHSIVRQVQQYLLDLDRIDFHPGQIVG